MWNETKQLQLNELQRRELENSLTAEEGQTLEKLLSELEQAEWQTLDPALEREREAQSKLQNEISLPAASQRAKRGWRAVRVGRRVMPRMG